MCVFMFCQAFLLGWKKRGGGAVFINEEGVGIKSAVKSLVC